MLMVKKVREEVFNKHPKLEIWKKTILGLPILLSASWIFYLQYNKQVYTYYGMELLAPADTTPLMIALIIFTMGYVIFLLMMFSENIKEFFAKKVKH